jgi:hypothetical protein
MRQLLFYSYAGQIHSRRHPLGRRGLRQPDGVPLHERVQAQAQEGHQRKQTCRPTLEDGLREGQENPQRLGPGPNVIKLYLQWFKIS